MRDRFEEQALALGAAMQALGLVRELATAGRLDDAQAEPLMSSLVKPYEGDLDRLYGGPTALAPGLRRLVTQLTNPQSMESTRYLAGVMHLEKKLSKNRAMLGQLGEGLEAARRQADYFHPLHENVLRNLGALYGETISQLGPRIMVRGDPGHLQDERIAAGIRTMLLAAIRAASLWRDCGGGKLTLILRRQRLVQAAHALLERVD
ncbi:high frequency lysogenization protein HflD [Alkalilimnicola ehrlichii]|uniref:high frequency lysogenization protein HflD n=1 Tax=Alkalilimnicola ehrlichii TaxID=351052 RepID=UPI003B9ECCAD